MARITLFPHDGTASIDGNYAPGVDYTGINPTIHCVQWYDTEGWVEYDADLMTGVKPPNETITSMSPYLAYVGQAETIIDAYLNPVVVYSTADDLLWEGATYFLGAEIVISTPNTLPPVQSTNEVPGTPEDFQQLWWYALGSAWILSPFDPTLSLAQAKEQLIGQVQTSGAEQADYQARIYSAYQLVTDADPGALPTADYYGLTLSSYQTYIDSQVAIKTSQINSAVANGQLYNFDWRVNGDPNA